MMRGHLPYRDCMVMYVLFVHSLFLVSSFRCCLQSQDFHEFAVQFVNKTENCPWYLDFTCFSTSGGVKRRP